MKHRRAGVRGLVLSGEEYVADVHESEGGVSAPHQRYDQGLRRLFDLRVRQGLSAAASIAEYERWLRDGAHRSNDLQRDRDRTIRRMVKDAGSYLAHLQEGIDAGRLQPGLGAKRSPRHADGALHNILSVVQHEAATAGLTGKSWRPYAASFVTPEDDARIAVLADPWLVSKVRLLVGLLRRHQERHAGMRRVTLGRGALQRIAGGRRAPLSSCVAVTEDGTRMLGAAYRIVLAGAERLGFIRFVCWGQVGKHANIYEVRLP